jgi:4-amino-4-deoxy-L-arabinose transferase-like glycosyltransferase
MPQKLKLDSVQMRKLGFALLILLAISGAVLVLYHSRYGLGTTGDSVHYLMGAQNILSGDGYGRTTASGEVRSITMLPPFYSTVMVGTGLMGLEILDGARYINSLFFGASILLVGLLIFRHTNSIWPSLIGAVIILASKEVIQFHAWLMPEALYIFLMLLMLYLLALYLESEKRSLFLLMSITSGLAILTRYIGVSLIALGGMSILILSKSSWKRKVGDCVLFAVISLGPIALWMVRNSLVAGNLANRDLGFHLVPLDLIRAYRAEISYWFVPSQVGLRHAYRQVIMIIVAILAPAAYFLLKLRENFLHKDREAFWTLPWILAFSVVAYFGSLFLNLTFFDAVIDFNVIPRYLTPVFMVVVIFFVIVIHGLLDFWKGSWIPRAITFALAVLITTLYAQNTLSMLIDPFPSLGYTGLREERADTVSMLRSLDRTKPIISNDPELVFVFLNRPAYMLPINYDFNTEKERDDFEEQVEATRDKLDRGGMLVLFSPMKENDFMVVDMLGAELMDTFLGSSFYAYPYTLLD